MKIAIVIPVHNRPEYLTKCLDSIKRADIPRGTHIVIINDGSTNNLIEGLIAEFQLPGAKLSKLKREKKGGVCFALLEGLDLAAEAGAELLINLDSDAVIRNDFVEKLTELHLELPNYIVTGFNCETLNANGTERHPIIGTLKRQDGKQYANLKKSVGGINMAYTQETYKELIRPALEKAATEGGNWDHMACIKSSEKVRPIACTVPSVVQHIGLISSLGHTSHEEPDTADDFKPLSLPEVTLIGVDCLNFKRLENAAEICQQNIEFGAVKLLTSSLHTPSTDNPNAIEIKHLASREAYSEFMIRELDKYVETPFALIIQYDGYILNYKAWRKEYLNYDYIGAPWWYKDGQNVGNGGFSLRSKKLISAMASDELIQETHPEDHVIGRTYRKYLEKEYSIKFAPEDLAATFSVEGWKGDKSYIGQFGFHGHAVKKPEPKSFSSEHKPETLIISQFQGIGDILFAMPLINTWIAAGHKVIWPVIPEYTGIAKHFPEVTFVDKTAMAIDYNRREEYLAGTSRVIPLRFAEHILKQSYKEVMRAKYKLYGEDWRTWRSLTWKRDTKAEALIWKILGLKEGERFNLVNKRFRTDQSGNAEIKTDNGLRDVEMRNIPGTTMLDWSLVIERAEEIHTVSTGVLFIIDRLETTDKLHQYLRKPDEKDYSLTDYLWTKRYEYHF